MSGLLKVRSSATWEFPRPFKEVCEAKTIFIGYEYFAFFTVDICPDAGKALADKSTLV